MRSREVDLSCLKGFHLHFVPKFETEKWHGLQLVFQITIEGP